jgi:hypothetical protein
LLVFALGLALFPAASSADIYMKQKEHSDAIQTMGAAQPAKDIVSEIWITEKGFRSDASEHSTIMLANEQKMIVINHKTKTYMEQNLNMEHIMGAGGEKQTPEQKAAMNQMMQKMMKMDATVTETGEQKTINGWKCRKYVLKINSGMGAITNEVWATEDLKVDKEVYDQLTNRALAGMPGLQDSVATMRKEMEKIKGVQVYTVSNFMVMNQPHKTTTEVLEFKEKTAPANILDIPAGYTKQAR